MFHLIAVFAVAVCAAGFILLGYRIRGRKPPKFLVPLAAGGAMLAYAIYSEYSWYPRTVAALPDHVTVVEEVAYQRPWQPWTYLLPRVSRFVAIDRSQLRRNDDLPGYVLAEVIIAEFLEPTKVLTHMLDCRGGRIADVSLSTDVGADGLPLNATWLPARKESFLFETVCDAR